MIQNKTACVNSEMLMVIKLMDFTDTVYSTVKYVLTRVLKQPLPNYLFFKLGL